MRTVCLLLILGACSRVETAEEAARIYADAHNRRDGGEIYNLLARRDREAWEKLDRGLEPMPGNARSDSPRLRFAAWMQKVWTDDRSPATVLDVHTDLDRAVAALDVGGAKVDLNLVREDGAWRVTFLAGR